MNIKQLQTIATTICKQKNTSGLAHTILITRRAANLKSNRCNKNSPQKNLTKKSLNMFLAWDVLAYFLRIFAAVNCAAAELKSKVSSVFPQLAIYPSCDLVLPQATSLCCFLFCREKPLSPGTLETGITQAILASLAHSG